MKLFKFVVLILFIFTFSCASEKQIVFNEEKISDPKKCISMPLVYTNQENITKQ